MRVLSVAVVLFLAGCGQSDPGGEGRTITPLLGLEEFVCMPMAGGAVSVQGEVVNLSQYLLEHVQIRFRIADGDGRLLGYAEGPVSLAVMDAGEVAAFQLYERVGEYHSCTPHSATANRGRPLDLVGNF